MFNIKILIFYKKGVEFVIFLTNLTELPYIPDWNFIKT